MLYLHLLVVVQIMLAIWEIEIARVTGVAYGILSLRDSQRAMRSISKVPHPHKVTFWVTLMVAVFIARVVQCISQAA